MQSSSSAKADVQEEPQGLTVSQIGVEVICHRNTHTHGGTSPASYTCASLSPLNGLRSTDKSNLGQRLACFQSQGMLLQPWILLNGLDRIRCIALDYDWNPHSRNARNDIGIGPRSISWDPSEQRTIYCQVYLKP